MCNITPKELHEFIRIELYKDRILNNLSQKAQSDLIGCQPFTITQFNYRARDPTKQPPYIYKVLCYLIEKGGVQLCPQQKEE